MSRTEGMPSNWNDTFGRIFLEDFPDHASALRPILAVGIETRKLERACIEFFESTQPAWTRYDTYLAYWKKDDPRTPQYEDGELVEDADFREAGKLLAHRLTMAFYADQRLAQFLENVDFAPYFQITTIEDERTHPDCIEAAKCAHRFDSPFWQSHRLPHGGLFCRCSLRQRRQQN